MGSTQPNTPRLARCARPPARLAHHLKSLLPLPARVMRVSGVLPRSLPASLPMGLRTCVSPVACGSQLCIATPEGESIFFQAAIDPKPKIATGRCAQAAAAFKLPPLKLQPHDARPVDLLDALLVKSHRILVLAALSRAVHGLSFKPPALVRSKLPSRSRLPSLCGRSFGSHVYDALVPSLSCMLCGRRGENASVPMKCVSIMIITHMNM